MSFVGFTLGLSPVSSAGLGVGVEDGSVLGLSSGDVVGAVFFGAGIRSTPHTQGGDGFFEGAFECLSALDIRAFQYLPFTEHKTFHPAATTTNAAANPMKSICQGIHALPW